MSVSTADLTVHTVSVPTADLTVLTVSVHTAELTFVQRGRWYCGELWVESEQEVGWIHLARERGCCEKGHETWYP